MRGNNLKIVAFTKYIDVNRIRLGFHFLQEVVQKSRYQAIQSFRK